MSVRNKILNFNGNTKQRPDYKNEIASVLRSNPAPAIMEERLLNYHESDIASAFDVMSMEESARLLCRGCRYVCRYI